MAEKGKGSKPKAKKSDAGVMAGLSATRPTRIGGRRRGTASGTPAGTGATPAATPGPKTAKPAPKSTAKAAPKATPKTAAKAAPKAAAKAAPKTAAKAAPRKPAAPTPPKLAAVPESPAKSTAKPPAGPRRGPGAVQEVRDTSKPRKPRAVRAGSPALKHATPSPGQDRPASPPPPASGSSTPSGTELVTTAIQAAGELAQIGVTVGGQILKRAFDRLPKP